MTRPRPRLPRAYGLVLCLGAALAPFLLDLDRTLAVYTRAAFRRSLSDVGLYALRDDEGAAHLQAMRDVDASIEARARKDATPERCARLLLYLPDAFAEHGHGSQLNTYLMAATTAAYLDRALVLVEPPLAGNHYAGGSQFGCPVDAFRETMTKTSAAWHVADDFPRGLSRLVRHPAWLSRGCPVPCADAYDYRAWVKMSKAGAEDEVTCANADGTESNALVVGGSRLRPFFRTFEPRMTGPSPQAQTWARNLGATPREADVFANIRDPLQSWDYVLGLMNKAGFLQLQPWIARDVELFLKSFRLPLREEYDAIHIRRGDKLIKEARQQVVQYWRAQGHADADHLPTNYIPFAHYLSRWDGPDACATDRQGKLRVTSHNVYVATDDPVVVREEIAALPDHVDADTVLWHGCHRLTFFFNPTDDGAFHLNGDGEEGFDAGHEAEAEGDSCFARYHRNVVSVADMMILAKARTFIGEYNSNWGRLVRTLRVRLNDPVARQRGGRAEGRNATQGRMTPKAEGLTRTLDTRVAWGSQIVRTPGV